MRIGLVLNILDEEYQISVYNGIKRKAEELGVEIICFQQENTNFSSDDFISYFPRKDFFDLDGVILLTSVITDNYEINHKTDVSKIWGDIPVVSVGQKVDGIPSLLIQTDDSMKQLVEHLILQHKYRKFLYISGSQNHHDAIKREEIFTKTIDVYKPWYPDLTYTIKRGWFTEVAAIGAMKEYMAENNNEIPDVVVCANDNMAIGVYKFFKMNTNNPAIKECAVTGFDDIPQAKYELPSLTTIQQPLKQIGQKALEIIHDMIVGKKVEDEYFIESKVMYRKSCGCNPVMEDNNFPEKILRQVQANYVKSENLLKMVSHIGQEMNYAESIGDLNNVINQNMTQLDLQNFCILRFSYEHGKVAERKLNTILVDPLYVRRNGQECFEFYREIKIPLGQFYKRYIKYDNNKNPTYLIFKYLTAGNEIIGCVFYEDKENVLPYLSSIAINIAQGLNRVKVLEERKKRSEYLEKEVNKRTKELVEANNKRMEVEAEVLKISEIERQRFSNDLHDDICQRLAGISMLCRSYSNQENPVEKDQMVELAQLIGETLQCTRQYAHNSYPVELESLGMDHSLSNLCNSFKAQSGIDCEYNWEVSDKVELDKLKKLNIFRIIQEALHNVMKHSKATFVSVSVRSEGKKLVVMVCDNGCGIEKNNKNSGLGMNSMVYRANQIGASFSVKKNKPTGTCVQLSMTV